MKRRAFLKSYVLGSAGLFVPRIVRSQAYTFFDPQVYRAKNYGINPVVSNWASRVVTNGGAAPSQSTQGILSNFVGDLQNDGIWAKMITVNCVAPDSFIAAQTPLLVGTGGNDPWTNVGFTGTELTINGLLGNSGAIKRLKTGITHTVIGPTTAGVSWYAFALNTDGFDGGGYDGTNGLLFAGKHSDTKTYAYNGKISANVISLTSPGTGFYCDLRVSTTDHKLYFANSGNAFAQIGATDSTLYNGTAFAGDMWTWCVNLSNGAQFPASDRLSFVAFHSGVTSSEGATLFSRVDTMRRALGGGFV